MELVNEKIQVDWQNNACVICGPANPQGLKVRFGPRTDGEEGVEAVVLVPAPWQGFSGVAHGGVVSGVLDDAMWYAIYQQVPDDTMMTAELTVRFREPVPVGQPLLVRGRVVERHHRLVRAEATVAPRETPDRFLATAQGRFLPAR